MSRYGMEYRRSPFSRVGTREHPKCKRCENVGTTSPCEMCKSPHFTFYKYEKTWSDDEQLVDAVNRG